MKLNKKDLLNLNEINLDLGVNKTPIIKSDFTKSVLDEKPGTLEDSDYSLNSYTVKDNHGIWYCLVFHDTKKKTHIDLSFSLEEMLSIYHLVSAVKDGFASNYTIKIDAYTALSFTRYGEKFVIEVGDGKKNLDYNIVSQTALLYTQLLYVMHIALTAEPKEYVLHAKRGYKSSIPEVALNL